MEKVITLIFVFIFCILAKNSEAQSLPTGTCGIVYTYDAAGNRTKRAFVLNNSPQAIESIRINSQEVSVKDILKVDVLYPNPTSGQFSVRLVKPLSNGTVTLIDISGRTIFQRIENGIQLNYNISSQPSGVYLLNIIQGKEKVTVKILKK